MLDSGDLRKPDRRREAVVVDGSEVAGGGLAMPQIHGKVTALQIVAHKLLIVSHSFGVTSIYLGFVFLGIPS